MIDPLQREQRQSKSHDGHVTAAGRAACGAASAARPPSAGPVASVVPKSRSPRSAIADPLAQPRARLVSPPLAPRSASLSRGDPAGGRLRRAGPPPALGPLRTVCILPMSVYRALCAMTAPPLDRPVLLSAIHSCNLHDRVSLGVVEVRRTPLRRSSSRWGVSGRPQSNLSVWVGRMRCAEPLSDDRPRVSAGLADLLVRSVARAQMSSSLWRCMGSACSLGRHNSHWSPGGAGEPLHVTRSRIAGVFGELLARNGVCSCVVPFGSLQPCCRRAPRRG